MNSDERAVLWPARALVVRPVGDELVVYDPASTRTHALNDTAAAVFDAVDGHRTVAMIAEVVSGRIGSPIEPELVEFALVELAEAGLVEVRGPGRLDRREMLRRTGAAAAVGAVALPVIQSVVAPSVAAAQSLGDPGGGDPGGDPGGGGNPGGGAAEVAGISTTFAGSSQGAADGDLSTAQFNSPRGLDVAPDGTIYVADENNHRIRAISPSGAVTTLAGGAQGFANGTGAAARFNRPHDVAVAPNGLIYVADSNNQRIRAVTPAGVVTTLAGTFPGLVFENPKGLTVAPDGTVYVASTSQNRIAAVTPTGQVSNVAGLGNGGFGTTDGTGTAALFNGPQGIAMSPSGVLVVADTNNRRIRLVTTAGVVTTLCGIGGNPIASVDGDSTVAKFLVVEKLTVAPSGNIYVVEGPSSHRIRRVTPAGVVTTIAGGTLGSADGTGSAAQFNSPSGIAIDLDGSLLVTERGSHRIRRVL